jgi:putative hydroxymethylpyrimidine transporter CytX
MGAFKTFALWVAAAMVITTIMGGTLFVPDLSPKEALVVIVLGGLVGGIPLALTGIIGTRTGLPSMVLLRAVFGHRGVVLPAILNGFVLIGWNWLQAYLAGYSLNYIVDHSLGYSNIDLFVIVTGVLVTLVTIFGQKGIEKTESLISILMLLLSLIIFVTLFTTYDAAELISLKGAERPTVTFAVGFDIAVAAAFGWMSSVCDYNRNCKSAIVGAAATYFGYMLAFILAVGLGMCVVLFSLLEGREVTYDPTVLLASSGFGPLAAAVILLSVLSTNAMGLYSATFSFLTVLPRVPFWKLCLSVGVLCTVGALLKEVLVDYLFDYVLLMGALFIPMFSMLLVDYFLLNGGRYDAQRIALGTDGPVRYKGGINYIAYGCFFLSAAFSYYFTHVEPLETGATLPTFFVSGGLYFVAMKLWLARLPEDAVQAVSN